MNQQKKSLLPKLVRAFGITIWKSQKPLADWDGRRLSNCIQFIALSNLGTLLLINFKTLLTRKIVYNPLICEFRYTCCRWHRNELTDVANNLRHWWLILFFVIPHLTFAILFVLVLRVFLHVNVVLHYPFYASLESLGLTFKSLRNKLFYTSVQDLWSILKEKSEWTL